MILVGDIGATKALLEVGVLHDKTWRPSFGRRYAVADYPHFDSILETFLEAWRTQDSAAGKVTQACFGVAGPTFDNRTHMTNIEWVIDGASIAARFGISRVQVINDFAAAASGIEILQDADVVVLQRGAPLQAAPRLVIGAGSGLGVAYLVCMGSGYGVIAGEAGHAGFAPSSLEQVELWRHLNARQGHVTSEHLVSGPGLVRILEFLESAANLPPEQRKASSPATPASISRAALEAGDPMCLRALDLFIACYGSVAGNHALAVLARGGVYIAGGIAPKILPRMLEGGFLAAFNARDVHLNALAKIPVSVVINERLGLLGCAIRTALPS